MMKLPALAVSAAFGIGFGYATLGVLSIIGTNVLGYQLWWLEVLIAVIAGLITFRIFRGIVERQSQAPRADSDRRAIWRLSYRKGAELTLEQIVRETMLEEGTALRALRELERDGQAECLGENRWRLVMKS
jgi:hypothetical protein